MPPQRAERSRPGATARPVARVWLDVLRCYALIALAFALLAWQPTFWAGLLVFVVVGTQQYALTVLGHDGLHGALARKRAGNDLLTEALLFAPMGASVRGERVNHLAHHRWLATSADPDRALYEEHDKRSRLELLLFLTGLTSLPRAFAKLFRSERRVGAAAAVPLAPARLWPIVVAQAVVFAAIAALLPWWCYFALWVAPVYPFVFVPHKIRMFCEHARSVPGAPPGEGRLVTYRPPFLERALLSPFNLNFHAEHHLRPGLAYHELPAVAEQCAAEHPIEVRAGYLGFVLRYFRALPLRAPL